MERAARTVSHQPSVVFRDGLGERRQIADPSGSDAVEQLWVRRELAAVPSFEFALRERVSRLATFRHAYYGRVRGVERAADQTLTITSDAIAGVRLSDLLARTEERRIPLDINAALCLIRQLVPAVAMLHENARDVAHGALGPERLIITPMARLVIVEHVMGAALEQLRYSQERYWTELRIAVPRSPGLPRFDHRTDVTQIGVVALSLILGRALRDDEYPARVGDVVAATWAVSPRGGFEPLPTGLRGWLTRALQLDPKQAFASAIEARTELDKVIGDSDYIASPANLEAFLARCASTERPAPRMSAIAPAPVMAVPPPVAPAAPPPPEWERDAENDFIEPSPPQPPIASREPLTPPAGHVTPSPAASPFSTPPAAVTPPAAATRPASVTPVRVPAPAGQAPTTPPAPPRMTPIAGTSSIGNPTKAGSQYGASSAASSTPSTYGAPPAPVSSSSAYGEPSAPASNPSAYGATSTPPSTPSAYGVPAEPVAPASVYGSPASAPAATVAPVAASIEGRFESPVQRGSLFELQPEPDAAVEPARGGKRRRRLFIALGAVVVIAAGGGIIMSRSMLPAPAVSSDSGTLVVTTNPPGAQAFIDGRSQGVTPMTLTLPAGAHKLELRGSGDPRTIPITIAAGKELAQYVELPKATTALGQLQVKSEPSGARVSVDGTPRGTAPVLVTSLAPGEHNVVLERDLGTVRQTVTVESGVTATLVVPLSGTQGSAASGWVAVTSPVVVQLFENGQLLGSSQSDRVMVTAGRHELTLVNDALGYRDTRTLQVPAGKTASVSVEIPKGTIALNAQPWAEVWIDGEKIGETPIGNYQLPVGTHDVVFRHPDLGEQHYTTTVTLKTPARLSVDLRKK